MKKSIAYLLLMAISGSVAAQTIAYTEQGGAVIVIDQSTGELVSDSKPSQIVINQCNR